MALRYRTNLQWKRFRIFLSNQVSGFSVVTFSILGYITSLFFIQQFILSTIGPFSPSLSLPRFVFVFLSSNYFYSNPYNFDSTISIWVCYVLIRITLLGCIGRHSYEIPTSIRKAFSHRRKFYAKNLDLLFCMNMFIVFMLNRNNEKSLSLSFHNKNSYFLETTLFQSKFNCFSLQFKA